MLRARGRLASMYMPPRMALAPFSLRRGGMGYGARLRAVARYASFRAGRYASPAVYHAASAPERVAVVEAGLLAVHPLRELFLMAVQLCLTAISSPDPVRTMLPKRHTEAKFANYAPNFRKYLPSPLSSCILLN
jgi:hypothetical protein